MKTIVECVCEYLSREGYKYTLDPSERRLVLTFQRKNAFMNLNLFIFEELRYIRSTCTTGLKVKRSAFSRACEYLMRANDGLKFGSFSLSAKSGEPTYVVAALAETSQPALSNLALRVLINTPLEIFDKYYLGLVSVLHSRTSPSIAIKNVSKERQAPSQEKVDTIVYKLLKDLKEPDDSSCQDTTPTIDGSESRELLPPISNDVIEVPKRKRGRPRKNPQDK